MADPISDSHPAGGECGNCGAPDDGEHVLCKFCKSPISKDLLTSAITCPTCKGPNRAGRTNCSSCSGSLLIACVFCGHLSAASFSDCQKCGQGFVGAAERKKKQGTEHLLGAVGNFVTGLVGAASSGSSTPTTTYSSDSSYSSNDSSYSGGGGGSGSGGSSDSGAPPMET